MWTNRWLRVLLGSAAVLLIVGGGACFVLTRPHYAWLTFGPQERLRVLLCDRWLWLSVTQYVDGRPAAPVERFREWDALTDWTLSDPDGQTTYQIASVMTHVDSGNTTQVMATVDIRGRLAYSQYCDLSLAATNPASANKAHFHGPLTAGAVTVNWKLPDELALARGDEPTPLRAFVGTMDAKRGCWVTVCSHGPGSEPRFPDAIRPQVEVAFPAASAAGPAVVERFALDQVCCGCVFYAPVRVPQSAGDGLAQVTFSFPAWSGAQVASSTIELPVVPAPPAKATDGGGS